MNQVLKTFLVIGLAAFAIVGAVVWLTRSDSSPQNNLNLPYEYWHPTPDNSSRSSSTPYVYVPGPRETSKPVRSEEQVEGLYAEQLATLDGETQNASRIRQLLKRLAVKTGDTEAHIADRTARCTVILKEDGKQVSNQRFLEEAMDYFNTRGPKTNYDDLSTMLIIGLRGR